MPKAPSGGGVEFILGEATKIRPGENKVELADGTVIDYDFLVIATGAKLAWEAVPGLGLTGLLSLPQRRASSVLGV